MKPTPGRAIRAEASRIPENGKPDSSRFPAGFQPEKITPFQKLRASRPRPRLSRDFSLTRGLLVNRFLILLRQKNQGDSRLAGM
jgi:hypothetical protein